MLKRISTSSIAYFVLLAVIILLRLLLALFPPGQIASQMVNLTDTLSIMFIWLIGWVGVYLAPGTGFAGMWQAGIPHTRRFLIPALVGLAIGLVTILFDLIQPLGEGSMIRFPASLVAYPLAGILEEIIFRLFLTTTLVWIVSNMLLRGRWQEGVFWGVTIFLGVFYTMTQVNLFSEIVGSVDYFNLARFFIMIAADFILAAYFYRKNGFLAAITLRIAYYLLWHVMWAAIARG